MGVDMYIYELLTNVYKRSFVEFHFGICDLIKKDHFFGKPLNQGRALHETCPFSPGPYSFYNMTVPVASIPLSFPFTKGRIYANISSADSGVLIGSGHINMELKRCKPKRQ
ncbi:uncharacterized protein LOC128680308 [Plodia interpunctella]|uniref:uncharacterized protein LOC128680308 n=1 Tax=Plodia interpunctella TaxID=58824 RepID=UPI002367BD46|nr:uncharacterized protein LOC128680308 [Plodia interpunctella]